MALENEVVTKSFSKMLTTLRSSTPALNAEQVADKMSDWIIASSVRSTVCFTENLPTKPEIGKIYLLKTGEYTIHNPNSQPFTGSLLKKLKTQLASPQSCEDPYFIFQVVKITTKMGHNPYEAEKQNEVLTQCLSIIDPAELQKHTIEYISTKWYLKNRKMANKSQVADDFYIKTLKANLKPKLSFFNEIGALIVRLLFTIFKIVAIELAISCLISLQLPQLFAIWALCDHLKFVILLAVIAEISNLVFSKKYATIITATCGTIISGFLAYQYLLRNIMIRAAINLIFTAIKLKNLIKTIFAPELAVPDNDKNQAFVSAAFNKANSPPADHPDDAELVITIEPIEKGAPAILTAFNNHSCVLNPTNEANDPKIPPASLSAA